MPVISAKPDFTACPHVDRNDHRCASHFSLGGIEHAFGVCFGAFGECPMYHAINREARHRDRAGSVDSHALPLPFTSITIHVDRHRQSLRATGT